MTLRSRDLRAVLAFVADAYDADGPHALSNELLDGLTELVGCEYATYETYDWPRRVVTAEVNCSNDPQAESPPYVSDGFWEGECRAFFTGATSDKMSDRFRRRERERLFKHAEHFDGFRIVDRLGVSVGDPRTRSAWLGFDSERRDFDERDRELALTLRPHLDALWRRATSRARVADLIAAIEGDGDAGGDQAIVLLDADGRIDHASAEAHRLLAGMVRRPERSLAVSSTSGSCLLARETCASSVGTAPS